VRAYTGCVQQALEHLPTTERVSKARLSVQKALLDLTNGQALMEVLDPGE
jgi:putative IMPACT (imprinted ancient) family translation regulator